MKPQNILLAHCGERSEYALLGDFGISRALDGSTILTHGIIGSWEYIAPEILRWQPASAASDQYSLACVLFEMLTGGSPYRGMELPSAHFDAPIPDAGKFPSRIPPALAAAVRRALAKEPTERFEDIRAFIDVVAGDLPVRFAQAEASRTDPGSRRRGTGGGRRRRRLGGADTRGGDQSGPLGEREPMDDRPRRRSRGQRAGSDPRAQGIPGHRIPGTGSGLENRRVRAKRRLGPRIPGPGEWGGGPSGRRRDQSPGGGP